MILWVHTQSGLASFSNNTHMSTARLLALLPLLLMISCKTARYPAPVVVKAKPSQPHYGMVHAMESARAAENASSLDISLSAWLRTALEAALLIEDRTTCGDGSISRVKVTRVYQHAVGRVVEHLQEKQAAGPSWKLWTAVPDLVSGPEGTWNLQVEAGLETHISSIKNVWPATAPMRASAFHVGVPVHVDFIINGRTGSKALTALIEFPANSLARSRRRARISFRDSSLGSSLVRLHPAGPQIPLRRAMIR